MDYISGSKDNLSGQIRGREVLREESQDPRECRSLWELEKTRGSSQNLQKK